MGAVYLGRDPDLDRNVAIKVLREPLAEDELLQRFLREAKATARMRHENLVTIYQVGEHDHQPFIAMEYVDGTTLAEIIKQRQPRPVAQKLEFIEQICAGLHYAHRIGIVHRDIKPANVMVDSQGVIRILDFGIARVANSGMTTDGAMIGTLNYMSPEQMIGRPVDFRSDIFSVGSLAYELLSYHQAFPGTMNDGLLHRLPHEDPAPFAEVSPGLPPDLEGIVFRALAKRPEDRFTNLDEMRTAVHNARRGVDPGLQLETVVIPSHNRPKTATRPSSSEDRRGLLERRARQIAVHRDAARAALTRGDVDAAAAACEDALTLDPDDAEASQLLVEIRQQKERRDEESRLRRERERTMRQRVADAELALQHGDVASAARQLERVLREEPHQPTALTLLDKVREAATSEGLVLPDSLKDAGREPTRSPARATAGSTESQGKPDSRGSRIGPLAAAAVVVLAVGVGVWWMKGTDQGPAPAIANNTPVPPASGGNESNPAPVEPSLPTTDAGTAASQPVPSVPPAPAPGATAGTVDPLAAPLTRINQMVRANNPEGALAELEGIEPSTDNRVAVAARSVWQAAARVMEQARVAADSQRAADLAPAPYKAAAAVQQLAEAASRRNDYDHSARQALEAASGYRRAESEAARAATSTVPPPTSVKPTSPPVNAATPTSPSPSPAPEPPATARAETPPPPRADPPPAAPLPSAPAAVVSVLDREGPGILRALKRYEDAYEKMNVDAIGEVYTGFPREAAQNARRQFQNCQAYDVAFSNTDVTIGNDPTAATVSARTTYTCTPKNRQAPLSSTTSEFFKLRKVGNEWLIEERGSLDGGTRRR